MKKKGLLIFTSLVIILTVVLVATYAGKVSLLYLEIGEVFAKFERGEGKELLNREMRIHGYLKPNSTKRLVGRLDYRFEITDKSGLSGSGEGSRSIEVRYRGVLPDTFRDRAELVIEGKLVRPNFFEAHTVLAKCPTKYKEEHPKKYGVKAGIPPTGPSKKPETSK